MAGSLHLVRLFYVPVIRLFTFIGWFRTKVNTVASPGLGNSEFFPLACLVPLFQKAFCLACHVFISLSSLLLAVEVVGEATFIIKENIIVVGIRQSYCKLWLGRCFPKPLFCLHLSNLFFL